MSKAERVPYEPITGLPLCLAPPERPLHPNDPRNSWHHGHHSEAYFLTLGLRGRAIRSSRLQLARNIDHNYGKGSYHDRYTRSKAPRSEIGGLRLTVFGVVNAVPGEVLDVRRGGTRPITEEERQRLFASGELRVQSLFSIKRLFAGFVIDHGIDNLTKGELSKYQNCRWEEDRKSIANGVIGRFLPIALKPINERYEEALAAHMLPPNSPPSPAELIRPLVFGEPARFDLFSRAMARIVELRQPAA